MLNRATFVFLICTSSSLAIFGATAQERTKWTISGRGAGEATRTGNDFTYTFGSGMSVKGKGKRINSPKAGWEVDFGNSPYRCVRYYDDGSAGSGNC